ncbi:3-phosphoshikimate 1-carboxyvinyltransferase [Roseibacillus ishigakijimensis]|uniref:3-phosphoshikimate 1-carboxyvinyltransferase n=1 Tax=Roseibacillus ishigakijimensis TaxID=454146 RepID=A0A934RTF2_9BACT|nr:3-phosphoshikimate 1-carboxyvinyltransferase [Roseibacillus ishigakijimensis]MBK1835123.1 3-phosphoshikimate 1-carboxyvinyltransferase [Roseibacillus ishigakijimensis]
MTPPLTLQPISRIEGEITLPGSKSISNRALLLAALAEGKTTLTNLLRSDDTRHMLNALEALGVDFHQENEGTTCHLQGLAGPFQKEEALELFLGNAGTAMRPLTAALALSPVTVTLTGEPRMEERPIGHLLEGLRELGAEVTCLKNEGYPPLQITGKTLPGGRARIDGSVSSQFLTALLMAAPLMDGDVTIDIVGTLVSKPYIDITLALIEAFGVTVTHENYETFRIAGGQHYRSPGTFLVEGDASSASYFLAAAAIKGGTVKVYGIGENSLQGDTAFAHVLGEMGAEVTYAPDHVAVSRKGPLKAVDLDLNHIPDAAMTIATTALFAEGTTTIRNIENWRVKETDRLAAMSAELRKVGATVEEGPDFITITPGRELRHAEIETYDDHRIAMCFSLVALSDTPVTILDPGCTAKTFPDYFEKLASLQKD